MSEENTTSEDASVSSLMASNFLAVTVSVRKWSATTVDADISNELTTSKQATTGAAKVVKSLMAGADSELRAVNSAFDGLRTFVYANTMPYVASNSGSKKGPRLLPVVNSIEFLKRYHDIHAEAVEALDKFCEVYDERKEQALTNQGQMANRTQYPPSDHVRELFGAYLSVQPVPETSDFSRGMIPSNVAKALGSRMQQQQENAMQVAMDDLRTRILQQVQRIAEQLGKVAREEKTRLYSTLIENVRQQVQLLKSSNITSNEQIDHIVERIEKELCTHDVALYRDNPTLADKTAKSAEDIGKLIDDIDFF